MELGTRREKNRHDYKQCGSKLSYIEVREKIEELKKTNPNLDFLVTSENEFEAYDLMVTKTTNRGCSIIKSYADCPVNVDC